VNMHATKCEIRLRALVVDDSPAALQTICCLMERHSTVQIVGRASDGCEAVDFVREFRPDVIVMDIQMPRMNGLEATRRIVHELPGPRIILVTLHDMPELKDAALKAGAGWFIPKHKLTSQLTSALLEIEAAVRAAAPHAQRATL